MPENEKKTRKSKAATVISIMDIKLTNSKGDEITIAGTVTDSEIRKVLNSFNRTKDQKFEIKHYNPD